jgi:hypothetical protein
VRSNKVYTVRFLQLTVGKHKNASHFDRLQEFLPSSPSIEEQLILVDIMKLFEEDPGTKNRKPVWLKEPRKHLQHLNAIRYSQTLTGPLSFEAILRYDELAGDEMRMITF